MGSFGVQCWGCGISETHPWNGPGEEHDAIVEDMKARGWMRRAFWPDNWDKGPWFCSENCAYDSYNAKQAEEYWAQKEFENYCQNTKVPSFFWAVILFLAILFSSAALERFC